MAQFQHHVPITRNSWSMFCQSRYVGVHISAGHKKGHIWGSGKSGGAQIKGDGRRNKSERTGVTSD